MPNADALYDAIMEEVDRRLLAMRRSISSVVRTVSGSVGTTTGNVEYLSQQITTEIANRQTADQALGIADALHAAVVASTSALGHVKVDGATITITDGVISAAVGGGVPAPFAYVVDDNGDYLLDDDGNYIWEYL